MKLLNFDKQIITIMLLVVTAQLWCIGSADAQGYVINENRGLHGSTYVVTPIEPYKPYVRASGTYSPSTTTATISTWNNPLFSVATPHWQLRSDQGYWGYYHTQADCDIVKKLLRLPLFGQVLSCRHMR